MDVNRSNRWSRRAVLSVLVCSVAAACASPDVRSERVASTFSALLDASRSVPTQAVNNGRSGAYTAEGVLKGVNVKGANPTCSQQAPASGSVDPSCYSTAFGRLSTRQVIGDISAQPLYVRGASTWEGTKNLLIIATRENYIYAFDADNVDNGTDGSWVVWAKQYAHPELGHSMHGEPVLSTCAPGNFNAGCPNTMPGMTDGPNPCRQTPQHVGITSTPVIDLSANPPAMYFIYRTGYPPDSWADEYDTTRYSVEAHYFLHKVDLAGNDIADVEIKGADAGVTFDPTVELQRPGLLLQNGVVFAAFGAPVCDRGGNPFNLGWPLGWVFAYDTSLNQRGAYTTHRDDPNNSGDPIWQSGRGLAGDGTYVYAFTGNSTCVQGKNSYCATTNSSPGLNESILQFSLGASGQGISLTSSFRDPNWNILDHGDTDLSAGGPMQIPGTYWMVGAGKQGLGYGFVAGVEPIAPWTMQVAYNTYCGSAPSFTPGSLCTGTCGTDVNQCTGNESMCCKVESQPCPCDVADYAADQLAGPNVHGGLVGWQSADGNSYVYAMAEKDYLRRATVVPGGTPQFNSPMLSNVRSDWGMPGGFLAISANGQLDGVVWALTYQNVNKQPDYVTNQGKVPPTALQQTDQMGSAKPGVMYALDALSMQLLWKDDDTSYNLSKFVPPTIADGKVFRPLIQGDAWNQQPVDPYSKAAIDPLTGVVITYGLDSIPPVIAENFAAAATSPTTMVAFEVDPNRTLNYARQSTPNNYMLPWVGLSGNVKSSPAAIGTYPTTGMEVYFISGTNKMFCSYQTGGQGGAFSAPQPVDDYANDFNFSPAIVPQASPSSRELFAVRTDGTLVHTFSTGNGTGACSNSGWSVLAGPTAPAPYTTPPFASTPAVGHNADGRLEVFILDATGAMWHVWENTANASLSNWSAPVQFPDGTDFASGPTVSVNADGRMEVFAIDAGGGLRHIWQTADNAAFTGWGGSSPLLAAGFSTVPAVTPNADGTMELIAVDASGQLWRWRQVAQNQYLAYDASVEPIATGCTSSPAIGHNQDGRLEIFTSCSSLQNGAEVNGQPGWQLYHEWETSTTLHTNEFSSPLTAMGIYTYPPF